VVGAPAPEDERVDLVEVGVVGFVVVGLLLSLDMPGRRPPDVAGVLPETALDGVVVAEVDFTDAGAEVFWPVGVCVNTASRSPPLPLARGRPLGFPLSPLTAVPGVAGPSTPPLAPLVPGAGEALELAPASLKGDDPPLLAPACPREASADLTAANPAPFDRVALA